jgi:hypothetical protein
MADPLRIPKQESEYLARRGRKSKNGVAFQHEGREVKHLQEALLALGYDLPRSGADGLFGAETQSAVRYFQRAHKDLFQNPRGKCSPLQVDGIVGPETALALNCALARAGQWFNQFTHEWTDEEGVHRLVCTCEPGVQKITLIPLMEGELRLHFSARRCVRYRIVDSSGQPSRNKRYVLYFSDGSFREGKTNNKGFIIPDDPIPAGDVHLRVEEPSRALRLPKRAPHEREDQIESPPQPRLKL